MDAVELEGRCRDILRNNASLGAFYGLLAQPDATEPRSGSGGDASWAWAVLEGCGSECTPHKRLLAVLAAPVLFGQLDCDNGGPAEERIGSVLLAIYRMECLLSPPRRLPVEDMLTRPNCYAKEPVCPHYIERPAQRQLIDGLDVAKVDRHTLHAVLLKLLESFHACYARGMPRIALRRYLDVAISLNYTGAPVHVALTVGAFMPFLVLHAYEPEGDSKWRRDIGELRVRLLNVRHPYHDVLRHALCSAGHSSSSSI